MRLFILLLTSFVLIQPIAAQQSNFEPAARYAVFSEAMNDSVRFSLHLPKEVRVAEEIEYPVIFLLDRQNDINYDYHVHTIDYLNMMSAIPSVIVVGIELPNPVRNRWTNPNATGGQADDFIRFICQELTPGLKDSLPLGAHHMIIGHSRTAIFGFYALSVRPDFFNSVIASSASNFDFGDEYQQQRFEAFIELARDSNQHFDIHFSSGTVPFRDLHEPAVDQFLEYLKAKKLPDNIHWKHYKENVDHMAIHGLTVNRALTEIFLPYSVAFNNCMDIIMDSTKAASVPWVDYRGEYRKASERLGYNARPDILFYNSVASDYVNDYNNLFKENNTAFAIEVLQSAVNYFPRDYEYQLWLGSMLLEEGNEVEGRFHLKTGRKLLAEAPGIDEAERQEYLLEVDELLGED